LSTDTNNEDDTMKKTMIFKPAAISAVLGLSAMMAVGTANAGDAPKSLNEDAVSLVQAVEIAKNATGGVVLEAERDVEMGQAVYEIELASETGEEIKTVVSATTGKVILTKTRRDHDDHHDDDDVEDAIWLSGIKDGTYLSLEQALMQAETQVGGKAWSIEQDDHRGEPSYEVELLDANGKRVETRINAMASK
jgi:uncharacterized membrane protein YkoI